ncbi:hypothetical protein ZYGR_0AI03070 [Zygosaccharomyces rouxii]|uniref:Coenzyme Q-binding protein COQ10 START domain-containing protein n=1 Tax=Zygosaccharomyces rouxii TaxID=4956 RepID=A0A1Q3ABN6_ZYGRO|nr:hypothetical protein ZYGR_0AI03070 [Zygosaccharomyces rouxii]
MTLCLWSRAKVVLGIIPRAHSLPTFSSGTRQFFAWGGLSDEAKEQKFVLLRSINSTPEKVYNVVSEVSEYQNFIPYCMESFVNRRDPINDKPIEAGLRVGFRQYDEKFLCEVECVKQDSQYKVVTNSISHNLFHLLYGEWTIKPHPRRRSSTQVELLLRFKFKSKLYNSVSSMFAKSVTELVMKAFERRVFELQRASLMQDMDKRNTTKN